MVMMMKLLLNAILWDLELSRILTLAFDIRRRIEIELVAAGIVIVKRSPWNLYNKHKF